ncbi:Alpha/Beta hydrolase protein [Podospora didyma]|uniref:Alpha/Beta hydrolase protein n=1 Tax=Podospora didyma TaxID=330526 RepID=A0AAE0K2V3_9PEZI|nr:Alpha/Beta hydrolase protein [Podospora didyma]
MARKTVLLAALSLLTHYLHLATAQVLSPATVHRTNWNSSFTLTPAQIAAAQLDNGLAATIQTIVQTHQTQQAFGGPHEDDFYTVPPLTNMTGSLKPGQILKVQAVTDATAYTIPPGTALSRIIYTTTNFNGTLIPASAFILWPYTARQFGSSANRRRTTGDKSPKASVVIWAHGTSGFFASNSPSSHRSLWYDNMGPYTLAEAGYAVVAPDYAGLGVRKSWDGSDIPHQYHVSPASAGDCLYAFRAALAAFPTTLGKDFVVMGHSQGGGVAWAVPELLVSQREKFADLVPGYKGTVAASPTTDMFGNPNIVPFMLTTVGQAVSSIFPSFTLGEWLAPLGIARTNLGREVEADIVGFSQLMFNALATDIYRADYNSSWYATAYGKLGDAGHHDFKGPLLVLQGTEDTYILYNITTATVAENARRFPHRDLEFHVVPGISHSPVLHASRLYWLQWIEDRFEGKPLAKKGNFRTEAKSLLPIAQYQKFGFSLPLWVGLPEFQYQQGLGI